MSDKCAAEKKSVLRHKNTNDEKNKRQNYSKDA